jgi:hypothetical protein
MIEEIDFEKMIFIDWIASIEVLNWLYSKSLRAMLTLVTLEYKHWVIIHRKLFSNTH